MIVSKYELQHLDVKPANLFLVAGHVKVGDYGLVAKLEPDTSKADHRGLTPKYVAPEVLRGQPGSRSDQYSLALVYQELLTGTFPYEGKTPQQLMMHHIATKPRLTGLPPADRPIVARALAKKPEERYASCLAFVQALMTVPNAVATPNAGMDVRRARVERSVADMSLPIGEKMDQDEPEASDSSIDSTGRPRSELTQNITLPINQPTVTNTPAPATIPGNKSGSLPQLVASRRPTTPPPATTKALRAPHLHCRTSHRPLSVMSDPRPGDRKYAVTLAKIKSILPVGRLPRPGRRRSHCGRRLHPHPGRRRRGRRTCPLCPATSAGWRTGRTSASSRLPFQRVIPLKLLVLREKWNVGIETPDPNQIVLRKCPTTGLLDASTSGAGWKSSSSCRRLGAVGEVAVSGKLFGNPSQISSTRRRSDPATDRRRAAGTEERGRSAQHPAWRPASGDDLSDPLGRRG